MIHPVRPATTVLVLFLGLWLLLGGCAASGAREARRLVGEWRLATLEGASVSDRLAPNAQTPTLQIDGSGRMSGFAGVNRMSSTLDLVAAEKREFSIGPITLTRMAGPPESMRVEHEYTEALSRAETFRFDREALVLRLGDHELARFSPIR